MQGSINRKSPSFGCTRSGLGMKKMVISREISSGTIFLFLDPVVYVHATCQRELVTSNERSQAVSSSPMGTPLMNFHPRATTNALPDDTRQAVRRSSTAPCRHARRCSAHEQALQDRRSRWAGRDQPARLRSGSSASRAENERRKSDSRVPTRQGAVNGLHRGDVGRGSPARAAASLSPTPLSTLRKIYKLRRIEIEFYLPLQVSREIFACSERDDTSRGPLAEAHPPVFSVGTPTTAPIRPHCHSRIRASGQGLAPR